MCQEVTESGNLEVLHTRLGLDAFYLIILMSVYNLSAVVFSVDGFSITYYGRERRASDSEREKERQRKEGRDRWRERERRERHDGYHRPIMK